ncbi:TonB-dependent receptor plug domain-containing protein [Undibacterium sp. Tian12W]|uniref:TonB-dependent receptor plug domain-containing protein n=1 Tax=Undibacterium sp. Tian12W TaxID=3413054 RepID=UPI003BF20A77
MKSLNNTAYALHLVLLLIALPQPARAEEPNTEEDLALVYGDKYSDKSVISVATGSALPLRRAPAVATVITAADIEATGATSLDGILETVPGLHVGRSTVMNMAIYTIRGMRNTLSNPQVLVLINGTPVINAYTGDRGLISADMPLENVARIEIIRGPGSALYGADAFSGVINIVTKTAKEQSGTRFGSRLGSFNSRDAWVLHGGKWGGIEVAASLQHSRTAGAQALVERDAQSGYDQLFGTHASLAPAYQNFSRAATDGNLDLAYGKWSLHMAFMQRENIGTGTGIAQALDPHGWGSSRRFTSDLKYKDPDFAKDWGLELNGSFTYYNENASVYIFPAGAFGGTFKDGFIGSPFRWERQENLNATMHYSGMSQHHVRLGFGVSKIDLYKLRETKNFNPDNSPINAGAFSDIVDVTDTAPYMRPHSRLLKYAYVQDEWQFAKDWTLTAGVRYDQYSDFGNTTNPRLALVWEMDYNLTAKLLYGTAFRAPSFEELYVINNPVVNGNPALKAERMRTTELALSWQARAGVQLGLNLFRYRMSDIIRVSNNSQNENGGRQSGRGFELEASWDVNKNFRVAGNLAYQSAIDDVTQKDPGLTPRRHAYLRADWQPAAGWRVNTQINHVADRQREPGDTRPNVKDYTTLDVTIGTNKKYAGWDWALIVRNLLNADVREPSPYSTPFINMPNDIPMGGRSVFLQFGYKL